MFSSVVIANRGEVSVRISRTLRRMGVRSVAVHSEVDADTLHARSADVSVLIGPSPAAESYLDAERVLTAAVDQGCEAVHPGYGFLAENAEFARRVEDAGLAWIGPTPRQLELFGVKDQARSAAAAAGVPLLAGTEVLADVSEAMAEAERLGGSVMLKSTAGGGGIGMRVCHSIDEVEQAYLEISEQSRRAFGRGDVFLERFVPAAAHLEVQVFGDGAGRIVTLGERDCSLQRRNQKVLEESPAPGLSLGRRQELADSARRLCESVSYRSAGTVEFIYDRERDEIAFLEVNTRLQVEHPVTEAVWGIDLVEWMVRTAAGEPPDFDALPSTPSGHAFEARIYAEDVAAGYRPSPGRLTEVTWPDDPAVRIDTWIELGSEVSPWYDPLLGKVIVHGSDRVDALSRLRAALDTTRVRGTQTNLAQLRAATRCRDVEHGCITTRTLDEVALDESAVEVLDGGTLTTVQDHPGRVGLWSVGVPPSGPMDDRSFRLANRAVGNPAGAPGFEITMTGPTLAFRSSAVICLAGADTRATLDGRPVPRYEPIHVSSGSVLACGAIRDLGQRAYLAIRGGLAVPLYLGSASTFTLGGFGGHGGRALRIGDVLDIGTVPDTLLAVPATIPTEERPDLSNDWRIDVLVGPHADEEFLTPGDLDTIMGVDWEVHHNSSRTGVRLIGPPPEWARSDGGEAGLHPSNIHDTAYTVGALDFTGDMPVILGPDGPSLGGFVCPVTITEDDRWKIGQLRAGDRVRFVAIDPQLAGDPRRRTLSAAVAGSAGILQRLEATLTRPAVTHRRSGEHALLVEYGPMVLDLGLRFRVAALTGLVESTLSEVITELVPGIRSLQIQCDPAVISVDELSEAVLRLEDGMPPLDEVEVSSREVHLPLSWDDPATRLAIERYMSSVRDDAPWCPWNIEFIRRINGLDSVDDVYRVVFDAEYLVLGLGDVYLGAPVATPVDPRHRLVTTKYNPARTWTAENSVGIGGAYLCIYGMEGPGGYQFVGRTVPVWNTWKSTRDFVPGTPWLLRFFDRIRFTPVTAEELLDLRSGLRAGTVDLDIRPGTFRLRDHEAFLLENAADIAAFRGKQQSAFAAERERWSVSGEFDRAAAASIESVVPTHDLDAPQGALIVSAPFDSSVLKVMVAIGDPVSAGDTLAVIEAMKTETTITSPIDGVVAASAAVVGATIRADSPLFAVVES